LFVSQETAEFLGSGYEKPYRHALAPRGQEAGISNSTLAPVPKYVRDHLGRWRLYHFHDTGRSSPLKKTADVNDNRYLQPNGSNLAAFLFLLRNRFQTEYDLVRRTVTLAAPFFDDFILEPDRFNEDKIRLEWRHKGSEAYFDGAAFSDGTLRFLALATLLLQPERFLPSVTMIDEPELGLHPYAIRLLASLIRQASSRTQVIISTQSTLLLDEFEPQEVLVADRVNGATVLTRLDPERLSSWLDDYSLGQLWEKNEIGGRPVVERG
jgi:predicted ATPase